MRSVLLALLAAACDPLADADYVGEPMFTLEGGFAGAGTEPVGAIALMWQDVGAGGPGVAATTLPVTAELATWKVAIPVPPPASVRVRFADADVEIAEAYVVAVGDGRSPRGGDHQGIDRGHVVVFASADVAVGTLAADYLGGPVSAGYHLRRFEAAEAGTAQRELIERCVARGSARAACETRRAYQLRAAADDDRLRIVVDR